MKTLFLSLLIVVSASAFDIVVYDQTSSPVANQVLFVDRSRSVVPTGFPANWNWLTYSGDVSSNWNGTLPPLATNQFTAKWCKVSGNSVVPMTVGESNSVLAAQAAAKAASTAQAQLEAKVNSTNTLLNYFSTPEGRMHFAFMEATMDALNAIRGGLAGNTNMPLLTLQQLTNAVKVRIAAQADNAP